MSHWYVDYSSVLSLLTYSVDVFVNRYHGLELLWLLYFSMLEINCKEQCLNTPVSVRQKVSLEASQEQVSMHLFMIYG